MRSSRFLKPSLQKKLVFVFSLTTVIVLIVNIFMYTNINKLITRLDSIYQSHLSLNELEEALDSVQNSMMNYLSTKTTDVMEDYYRSEQTYTNLISLLREDITDDSLMLMERNIKKISENYLDLTNQAIEAKRGRNIVKYKARSDNATELYHYLSTYIYSLSSEQFKNNSMNYSALSSSIRSLEMVSNILLIGVALGNLILIILLTQTITLPLKKLAKTANQVADGNFLVKLVEVKSEDEVGVVTRAFDKMVVNLRDYIQKLTDSMETERKLKERELKMETHLKDAQLKYLLAQINPHFLFNTLNAGAQLAMIEGADRTCQYVQNVAEFFRYNLKENNEVVSIADEVTLVDNYIYILNVRFSGEICFEKNIDSSVTETKIPSMILQPIVENSVNYGIRDVEWEKRITLSVYRANGRIHMSIKDNGVGMPQAQIDRILSNQPREAALSRDNNGIGLNNVIGRVRLFFGKDDIISIISAGKNLGTEVIISVPERPVLKNSSTGGESDV